MVELVLVADAPTIKFPAWVAGPTPCMTRTFSTVLPRHPSALPHGAQKIVGTFPNRPTKAKEFTERPGYFYTAWNDFAESDIK